MQCHTARTGSPQHLDRVSDLSPAELQAMWSALDHEELLCENPSYGTLVAHEEANYTFTAIDCEGDP
jgi:hypothetical protein